MPPPPPPPNGPPDPPPEPPPLPAGDAHCLAAVEGWLELGNPREAASEWQRLSPDGRQHPASLERRWQVLAQLESWDEAVDVATELVHRLPGFAAGWLHQAYALRRSGRGGLPAAWDILHAAADRFPDESVIAYNLACYATQLGRPDEGWEWYLRAVQISGSAGQVRKMALLDQDLEPLWPRIRGLGEA